MNYLKLSGPGLLFILCCATGFAQNRSTINEPDYNKPALFSNFPDKIPDEQQFRYPGRIEELVHY